MFGSLPAVTVHTPPTLPDRPTRAAKERAEPDPGVAIATRAQTGASGRAMADGKRTIPPDLRELIKLARGAFCDLDLDVVLERVAAAARHMSSARYAPLGVLDRSGGELERFVAAGVDGVTRRRVDALPRGRGVRGELIASPVPLRVGELGAHRGSYGYPGEHPPNDVDGAAVSVLDAARKFVALNPRLDQLVASLADRFLVPYRRASVARDDPRHRSDPTERIGTCAAGSHTPVPPSS